MKIIPFSTNNPRHEEAERRASGRVSVPPAVRRVPRSTRRMITGGLITLGVRVYSAGREIRQAGRPPYPRHAVPLFFASIRVFRGLKIPTLR